MRTMMQAGLTATAVCLLLSGCGQAVTSVDATSGGVAVVTFQGQVNEGQQPVSGATLKLYAAGSTGYGSAYAYTTADSLLGNYVVTTNSSGHFVVSGQYQCPASNPEVYLVARGGTSVAGAASNPNLAMMTALGPCLSLNSSTVIQVNELTTVASVWALAPFMTSITNVGTSAGNSVGLANAFAAVNKLVNTSTGTSPGLALPATATLPTAELNSLADILAACVNSSGGTAGDHSLCGDLFALAVASNGTSPTDTLTAMLNIAHNPAQNVPQLNLLSSRLTPFQPTLPSAPTSWTIAIRYGGLSAPRGIAADQSGNLWIANSGAQNVVELSSGGSVTGSYASGLAGTAVAIDQSGNAWASASSSGSLLRIAPGGTVSTVSGGGLGVTTALAVDGTGQIWAAGSGSTLSGFSSAGAPLATARFSGGGASNAQSLAITPK